MLIATAGHIDHGKTSLVRALTGVETDRLPEERARGISIDIGFAYWRPQPDMTIGFVDVPGHEKFIRNMLAGVGSVDFALLVVAADDGVMPQTVEHLQILDLLGISRGIAVITKCDRSSAEQIEIVRLQVQALLASTVLAGSPIIEVSSTTRAGIDELADALQAAARGETPRGRSGQNFRLAIDKAFSVTGAGTVVSGTVLDGVVAIGDRLVIAPRGIEVRVRGIQSGGRAVTQGSAGERCALSLAGVELAQVHRGDWLLTSHGNSATTRLEVSLKVLHGRRDALKHHTPVHLHLGTADILARVLIPAQQAVASGAEAVVQLVLETPTCAMNGDRFVLRDQSGRQTLGGGYVIDPYVTGDRRLQARRAPITAALQLREPALALDALLDIPGYELDTSRFERTFNLESASAQELYRGTKVVLLGGTRSLGLRDRRVEALNDEMVSALREFHAEHPESVGMTARELRGRLASPPSTEVFLALQRDLTERLLLEASGTFIKLPGHSASFSPSDIALWQRLLPRMEERGAMPFTAREMASEIGASELILKDLFYRRRANGDVWRVTEERFMTRRQVAALAAAAAVLAKQGGSRGFTAAEFRTALDIGRNTVIRLLEFFDNIGVTRFHEDARKMQPDFELVVGPSSPYTPVAKSTPAKAPVIPARNGALRASAR